MTYGDLVGASNEELRKLQVWQRSVRLENRTALRRRQQLAKSGALDNLRVGDTLFRDQRDLLSLLEISTDEEVDRMADCATPLFRLRLRCTDFKLDAFTGRSVDPIEAEGIEESFLALAARLDAVRTDLEQARIVFGLTKAEALWLSRYCPHELYALARDPSMALQQVAHWDYFVACATRSLSREQRSLLSAVSRRSPATMPAM